MFWAGLAAFFLFAFRVARVVLPLAKQWRMGEDELRRIMLKGINPWLFFGAWGLFFGMSILANVAR
jgi:hypothetical protein